MKVFASIVLGAALISCGPQTKLEKESGKRQGVKIISVPDLPALGPYSQAVEAGGLVYLSGVVAYDAKAKAFVAADIDTQTRQVFANIEQILAAANLTLKDVVKTTVFLKNPKDFAPMNKIYAEYFTVHKPARSTVPGVDWGRDDVLIEIEVIAKTR